VKRIVAVMYALAPLLGAADFTATILHVNDTHARIEPTLIQGKPYGGMARLGTLIERYRASDPNVLFLHGGDAFQGTPYFNTYEGLADAAFFNAMGLDAMAVGNHEFDRGPAPLATFARNALFPLLSANIDATQEASLRERITASTIVARGGERIGIVGATTDTLLNISNTGPTIALRDLRTSVQVEIDRLTAQGINKIVMVTHVGYNEEQVLARALHGVDVIVGGHSHSLLGSVTRPGWAEPWGPYPTRVQNADGETVLIVQAWEGARVLGRMKVTFDGAGRVKAWTDAEPIPVDETVPEQPALRALAAAFEQPILELRQRKIGVAETLLPQTPVMGEIIADAMVAATASQGATLALMNSGGVRASIEPGDITFAEALVVQPFGNTLIVMDVTGAELRQAIEDSLAIGYGGLYVSRGVRYAIDFAKPVNQRVLSLTVDGKAVDPQATYRIVTNNFMAGGNDAMSTLKAAKGQRIDTQLVDLDVLVDYLRAHSPFRSTPENRRNDQTVR
jgi:5'-nucleotidase / UDP-sugar diphosphatase